MKKKIILAFVLLLATAWASGIVSMVNKPNSINAHLTKAEDLEERGIYIDAIAEYEKALALVPEDVGLIIKIANNYLKIDKKNQFIRNMEKAIEVEKEGSNEALDLLMNYYIDNDIEYKAAQYILDYTKRSPDNMYAHEWLLRLKGSFRELYCRYDEMLGMYNDNMVVRIGDSYSLVDQDGSRVVESAYPEITNILNNGFARTVDEKKQWVYIDTDGLTRIVPDSKYDDLGVINDSRIVAKNGNKYGYLDEKGEPVTEFIWDGLTSCNKVALAERNGKWAIIDSKGKEKTEYLYDGVITDQYGIACNQDRVFVKIKDKYMLVTAKGKEITKETFDDAKIFTESGYAAICKKGKWGFVNVDGEIVIDCQYEDAKSFSNGYAAVCKDGLWGYVDADNNMIIDNTLIEATPFSSAGTAAIKVKLENDTEEDGSSKRNKEEWRLIRLNILP